MYHYQRDDNSKLCMLIELPDDFPEITHMQTIQFIYSINVTHFLVHHLSLCQ